MTVSLRGFTGILGNKQETWPIKYLRLCLGGNLRAPLFWKPVLEKMAKRLRAWKQNYLSLGGRIALIRSTLSNLHIYYFSIFKARSKVIKSIDKMQRDFLQELRENKKYHLIKWDVVSKPLGKGGLGLGKLSIRNDALPAKWLWRFLREEESMWHSVIGAKYGMDENGQDVKSGGKARTTCPWKNISRIYHTFIPYMRYDMGRGDRVKFWEDIWWGEKKLAFKFQRIYFISSKKGLPISCYSSINPSSNMAWDLGIHRGLRDHEVEELSSLISLLSDVFTDPSS